MATEPSSCIGDLYLTSDYVPDHSVIAAIDFGTSSSGYAFGFTDKGSDHIKLSEIRLNKWQQGSASSSTDKTPTTVLLKPDKSFHSFGYDAEDKYAILCDTGTQKGWWYFQKFKMMLYDTKLSREVLLHDAEGKTMPAKDVFSIAIGHLKYCVLKDVRKEIPSIKDEDILYVLTVPAIWSDAAKQFMREAATDPSVGITDIQLTLALEPEAASVFCRQRTSRRVQESDGNPRLAPLEIGHKYILLDLGGGTADIVSHEIIEDGHLHETDYARGGKLGGQQFNEDFLQFFSELIGEETFLKWRSIEQGDYLRLQRSIEGIKWKVADPQENEEGIFFEIPSSIEEHVQNETRESFREKFTHSTAEKNVKILPHKKYQFLLDNNFVRGFFDIILTGVTKHMNDLSENTSGIATVFIVGGLAKSPYVFKYIQDRFPQYTCIVPEDVGVAVLKGAVMLGDKPKTVATRRARFSYGIGKSPLFVEGKHADKYKFTRDGKARCKHVFDVLIEKGQCLKHGDIFKTTAYLDAMMSETKQSISSINIFMYISTSKNPFYHTEQGCTLLGGFKIYQPEGGWPDITHFDVKIIFGEAEFKFYVTDSLGGKYETTLDILAQQDSN